MGIKNAYASETLAQRVKRLRESKGMSQGELARRCGYAGNMPISNLENGRTKNAPEAGPLAAMAEALGVSVHYLLRGAEAESDEASGSPKGSGLAQLFASGRGLREGTRRALLGSEEHTGVEWNCEQWSRLADVYEGNAAANEALKQMEQPVTKPTRPKKLKR